MQSVHLQLPADLLARVDEAAGDVPRNRWIRRAIEGALGILSESGDSVALRATCPTDALEDFLATVRHLDGGMPLSLEAWQKAVVKRGVQPRPKGGKK